MFISLSAAQLSTIARLQRNAVATQSHPLCKNKLADVNVSIAELTDTSPEGAAHNLLHDTREYRKAVIVSMSYVPDEPGDLGEYARGSVIVLQDGTPLGGPYELTRMITVTAPFGATLDGKCPDATDVQGLFPRITEMLSTVAATAYDREVREREQTS